MKIMTVLGTRPEIIRLSRIIPRLDQFCTHVLVHTGQNYDSSLNDIFFTELGLRAPNHSLACKGTFGAQVGKLMAEIDGLIQIERPDKFLVLGDTNSSISAVVAKRTGIPVYHMEAGNRCYDDRVPEEVNRRLIDHVSDVLLPYTERSRDNLLREGVPPERILVTGNPIREVLTYYSPQIEASSILDRLDLTARNYFLVTLHRAENVDVEPRLQSFLAALERLAAQYDVPVIVSTHPRTKQRLRGLSGKLDNGRVRFLDPFGFFDFVALERSARVVLTDSGTVQEECAIFGVPNVTLRDTTERPETLECGSNVISGSDTDTVISCVRAALQIDCSRRVPPEYAVTNVSDVVLKVLLGYTHLWFNKCSSGGEPVPQRAAS